MTAGIDPDNHRFDLNMWLGRSAGAHEDHNFAHLADALRELQTQVAGSRPPPDVSWEATRELKALSARLREYEVSESGQVAGRQFGRPSRGQTFLPPLDIEVFDGTSVEGRVRFDRFYLGSNDAAHGGAISLLFDDLLGQLANVPGSPRARTAYLHLDYRQIVPLNVELDVTARIAEATGRKVFIEGAISDRGRVLTEARGLWVRLQSHHR